MVIDRPVRDRISGAISDVLKPIAGVLAGWEGGSAAFGALDEYSDIDLNYLVDDEVAGSALCRGGERIGSGFTDCCQPHGASRSLLQAKGFRLLRMRYCPERWDFGLRYVDRDLPADVGDRLRALAFIQNLEDLDTKLVTASAWGNTLLREFDSGQARVPEATV